MDTFHHKYILSARLIINIDDATDTIVDGYAIAPHDDMELQRFRKLFGSRYKLFYMQHIFNAKKDYTALTSNKTNLNVSAVFMVEEKEAAVKLSSAETFVVARCEMTGEKI